MTDFKDQDDLLRSKHVLEVFAIASEYCLFIDKIEHVDGITIGHSEVADSLEFLLSPYFGFQGQVISSASSMFDRYDGLFRMTQPCIEDTVWFASSTLIDPAKVVIPVDMEPIRKARPGLFNGLCYEFGTG